MQAGPSKSSKDRAGISITGNFPHSSRTMDLKKEHFRLTVNGICPCGGKLVTSEWETKTHRKGRTTCSACGRTELKREKTDDIHT